MLTGRFDNVEEKEGVEVFLFGYNIFLELLAPHVAEVPVE